MPDGTTAKWELQYSAPRSMASEYRAIRNDECIARVFQVDNRWVLWTVKGGYFTSRQRPYRQFVIKDARIQLDAEYPNTIPRVPQPRPKMGKFEIALRIFFGAFWTAQALTYGIPGVFLAIFVIAVYANPYPVSEAMDSIWGRIAFVAYYFMIATVFLTPIVLGGLKLMHYLFPSPPPPAWCEPDCGRAGQEAAERYFREQRSRSRF
jgi:hypothetical protein